MKFQKGFTLIELLLTIAIIAIISTLTMTWVGTARAKSADTKAIRELQEVRTALSLYLNEYERYPNESAVLSNPYIDNFTDMAQELVDEGYLPEVPTPPGGHTYQYYNYGPNDIGALLVTTLETHPESATGYSGSCRPWSAGEEDWCTAEESKYYCLCLSY